MSGQAVAVAALERIQRGCERLRRLPLSRWQLPPLPPMGSRPAGHPVELDGPTLELRVRAAIAQLMADEVGARDVVGFEPEVGTLALPDVLEALARSVAARADASGVRVLEQVADDVRDW